MPPKDIRPLKLRLRQKYRFIRENMDVNEKKRIDNLIEDSFFNLYQYKSCEVVFTYVSKEIEVDTKNIIDRVLKDGKRVAVPRCVKEGTLMNFYYIKGSEDLEHGAFGVLEPIVEKCEKVSEYEKAICIVPGLAFDTKGFRLGYGKGYYDRFLSTFNGLTVGICYSKCIQWELPHGFYDRPVDILITEKYLRKTVKKKTDKSSEKKQEKRMNGKKDKKPRKKLGRGDSNEQRKV